MNTLRDCIPNIHSPLKLKREDHDCPTCQERIENLNDQELS